MKWIPFRGIGRLRTIGLLATALASISAAQGTENSPGSITADSGIELSGSIEAFEKADLYAKVSGYIEEITVDIGDEVHAGDAISRLTIPEMGPELLRAKTAIAEARAQYEKARADASLTGVTYTRYSDLYAKEPGAITKQEVDVAKAEQSVATAQVSVANASIASAEAEVARLEALMDYAIIKAPFDGVITKRYLDTGSLVVAGTGGGKPLVEIMRKDKVRLVVYVPEAAASSVKPGTPASVTIDALKGLDAMDASVTRCSGSLMPDTRSMRAEIELSNSSDTLKPGMFAKVRLKLTAKEAASE
ncbi:MAG: efflux RND transporter periplasmic adaptor subunit [Candidatus Hydrogenedentes bacterium]|nr:efflux RND transporter periplasmic adaptor subunit [Candidatus Hydrogenedentota bacterium]